MADVKIDRLTLNLSGLSARDAQRLARLVAEGLGAADLPNARARRVGALRVAVRQDGKADVDKLSEQIVAEVLRQLERSL